MRSIAEALKRFVNSEDLDHEMLVVVVSYVFVFAGAWNDAIVGLTPSVWSAWLQDVAAAILGFEIVSRLVFSKRRGGGFYGLLVFDMVSLLTVVPIFTGLAFARLPRLAYASWRTLRLLDMAARRKQQTMYLLWVYPLVVPLVAALLYAVERNSGNSSIHSYFSAVAMCFAFSLTLGASRPHTYAGNLICGGLFVGGIICIGIVVNSLTERYSSPQR